jgi:hypothetical protein
MKPPTEPGAGIDPATYLAHAAAVVRDSEYVPVTNTDEQPSGAQRLNGLHATPTWRRPIRAVRIRSLAERHRSSQEIQTATGPGSLPAWRKTG